MRNKPSILINIVALALAAGAPLAAPAPARADIVVNVDQGVTQPLPIAIPAFGGSPMGAQIREVVAADLARSGLFKPLDPATFPPGDLGVNAQPVFDSWKAISAQGLVVGQASESDGRVAVEFRLWDVYAGEQLAALQLSSASGAWRHVAHKIADAIYEKLTGQAGYFDTRVVFVGETGPRGRRVRRLQIMDQDGVNMTTLTDGSYGVYFPSLSADNRHVAYMGLRPSGSTLYVLDLDTGRQQALPRFPGMAFGPRFSPDGRRIALSAERDGNTDIYVTGAGGAGGYTRLTHDPAIDTSPCFSPDGSQIVFNSDRGGSPQIYVMNADGSNVHRISFGPGRYTTPVWSPDGKYIAFTKQEGAVFHIGVMKPDGSDEKILTTAYLDEGPSWAPNSRVLVFGRDTGYGSHLWTVDISGRLTQAAPYPLSASDPSWSALLP